MTQSGTRVFFEVARADSKRQAQRCHHQPESLIVFLTTEAAESEFRTWPVATAVSATVGVDTLLYARRRTFHTFLVRTSQCWFKVTGICVAHFCAHVHLVCHVFAERSFSPVPSGHVRPQPRGVE